MRNLIKFLTVFSTVLISSQVMGQSLVSKANSLIENNQFSEAEKLILSVSPENGEYKQLKEVLLTIKPAQEAFVQKSIDEANLYYLNRDTDYGRAISVITEALKVLPNDPALQESFSLIDEIRKKEATHHRQEVLLKQGRYLLDVIPFEKTIRDLYPDDQIVLARYDQFIIETQQVANQLAIQAKQLFKEDIQLASAHSSALLAYQLYPNEEITQIYTQIDLRMKTRIADNQEQEVFQLRERNEVEINYWTDQFTVDLTSNDITQANRAIKELQSFGVDTSEMEEKVSRRIDQIVQRALDRGNTLWGERRIEEALEKWLEVQQYGRDNRELNNNIAMAQRFIAYYNEVRNKND